MKKKTSIILTLSIILIIILAFFITKTYQAEEPQPIQESQQIIKNKYNSSSEFSVLDNSIKSVSDLILKIAQDTLNQTTRSSSTTTSSSSDFSISGETQSTGSGLTNTTRIYGKISDIDPPTLDDGTTPWTLVNAGNIELGQIYNFTGTISGSTLTVTNKQIIKRIYPRVLTLGDSITFSPADAWNGNVAPGWGMKASSPSNDYVHLLLSALATADARNATSVYSSNGAGQAGGRLDDVINKLHTWEGLKADLITIQIGENDNNPTFYNAGTNTMTGSYYFNFAYLLDHLLNNTPVPRIICLGTWNPDGTYTDDFVYAIETANRSMCEARGLPFKSLKDIALNQDNHDPDGTGGLSNGINWHPNDGGMQGYFNLFWEVLGPEVTGIAQ